MPNRSLQKERLYNVHPTIPLNLYVRSPVSSMKQDPPLIIPVYSPPVHLSQVALELRHPKRSSLCIIVSITLSQNAFSLLAVDTDTLLCVLR